MAFYKIKCENGHENVRAYLNPVCPNCGSVGTYENVLDEKVRKIVWYEKLPRSLRKIVDFVQNLVQNN